MKRGLILVVSALATACGGAQPVTAPANVAQPSTSAQASPAAPASPADPLGPKPEVPIPPPWKPPAPTVYTTATGMIGSIGMRIAIAVTKTADFMTGMTGSEGVGKEFHCNWSLAKEAGFSSKLNKKPRNCGVYFF